MFCSDLKNFQNGFKDKIIHFSNINVEFRKRLKKIKHNFNKNQDNMFSSKSKPNFHPRKSNKRKTLPLKNYDLDSFGHRKEFGLDYSNPNFKLGDQIFEFDLKNGYWHKKTCKYFMK